VIDKEINHDEFAAIMQSRIGGRPAVSQANLMSAGFPAFQGQEASATTNEGEEVSGTTTRGRGSTRGRGRGRGRGSSQTGAGSSGTGKRGASREPPKEPANKRTAPNECELCLGKGHAAERCFYAMDDDEVLEWFKTGGHDSSLQRFINNILTHSPELQKRVDVAKKLRKRD
jgi:hypothetical protein